MRTTCTDSALTRRPSLRLLASTACSLALLGASPAHGQTAAQSAGSGAPAAPPVVSATLEECVTTSVQAEREVTFAGEMTAIAGTTRMAMRFDVEERDPGEAAFHAVSAPGLGVWRASDAKVKTYRYLKQVTNLTSPAVYRALVHFRWINSRGHVLKRVERLTPRCAQLAPAPETSSTTSTSLLSSV